MPAHVYRGALRRRGGDAPRDARSVTGTGWTRPVSPGARCLPCIRRPPPYGTRTSHQGWPATAEDRAERCCPWEHAPLARPAERRLADSHLASPTAMHAVGPPPFPRRPEAMSRCPAQARGLFAGGRPRPRDGRARVTLGAMTQAWDKALRARGYRVTPQR